MRHKITLFGAVISMAFLMNSPTANAEEVDLPIGVNLVRCGESKADIPNACQKDERCCVFMHLAPQNSFGGETASADLPFNAPKQRPQRLAAHTYSFE